MKTWYARNCQVIDEKTDETITVMCYADYREDAESNSKLMAAAPDLLESLQWMLDMCIAEPETHIYREHIRKAQNAVNKAIDG